MPLITTTPYGPPVWENLLLSENPAAWWRLNETTGITSPVVEQIFTGSLAAIDGTFQSVSSGIRGGGTAFQGDGVTYLTGPLYGNIKLAPISIELWFRGVTSGTTEFLYATLPADANTSGRGIQVVKNALGTVTARWGDGSGSYKSLVGSVNVDDSNWHHIVVTHSGVSNATVQIYVDGSQDNVATLQANITYNVGGGTNPFGSHLLLGCTLVTSSNTPTSIMANGSRLDEVVVYGYVMTPTQISTHAGYKL